MEKHILIGLTIPVLFLGFTGLTKSLIRRELFWSNFYLGVDIALAAMANGIVNIVDEVHIAELAGYPREFGDRMVSTVILLVASFGALLVVMFIHQRWEEPAASSANNRRWVRGIWLGLVSNAIGGFVLGAFIYWKLKGQI